MRRQESAFCVALAIVGGGGCDGGWRPVSADGSDRGSPPRLYDDAAAGAHADAPHVLPRDGAASHAEVGPGEAPRGDGVGVDADVDRAGPGEVADADGQDVATESAEPDDASPGIDGAEDVAADVEAEADAGVTSDSLPDLVADPDVMNVLGATPFGLKAS